jgi:hypothetical protein
MFKGIQVLYGKHRRAVLIAGIALMSALAAVKLSLEFYRLIFEPGWTGAVDLEMYYKGVHAWFEGKPMYTSSYAPYPPATEAMLWPFLGWLSLSAARWLWAIASVFMLGRLVLLTVRESNAAPGLERVFIALVPLSMNATGVQIGNGQLALFILPVMIAGLLLLTRRPVSWSNDLLAAVAMTVFVLKPTVGIPFLWIALLAPFRLRPFLLMIAIYLALTWLAMIFRNESLSFHLSHWLQRGSNVAREGGYADIHTLLARAHLPQLIVPSSLLLLLLLGIWIYFHRRIDLWILIGVTALIARLWANHRLYDDILILLPLISLFRIAKSGGKQQMAAAVLFSLTLLAMLVPARITEMPWPRHLLITAPRAVLWLLMLALLMAEAYKQKKAAGWALRN